MDIRNERRRATARLSRALALTVALLMGVILAVFVWLAVRAAGDPEWFARFLAERHGGRALPLMPPARFVILVVMLAQAALTLYALDHLRRAFMSVASGAGLSARTGALLRRSGLLFGINCAAMILAQPVTTALYSVSAPKGQGFISVGFGSGELMSLLLSAVLFVTGHLMAEAAEIEDEMRQIV